MAVRRTASQNPSCALFCLGWEPERSWRRCTSPARCCSLLPDRRCYACWRCRASQRPALCHWKCTMHRYPFIVVHGILRLIILSCWRELVCCCAASAMPAHVRHLTCWLVDCCSSWGSSDSLRSRTSWRRCTTCCPASRISSRRSLPPTTPSPCECFSHIGLCLWRVLHQPGTLILTITSLHSHLHI